VIISPYDPTIAAGGTSSDRTYGEYLCINGTCVRNPRVLSIARPRDNHSRHGPKTAHTKTTFDFNGIRYRQSSSACKYHGRSLRATVTAAAADTRVPAGDPDGRRDVRRRQLFHVQNDMTYLIRFRFFFPRVLQNASCFTGRLQGPMSPCTSRPISRRRPGAEARATRTTATRRRCTTAAGARKRWRNRRRGGRSTCCSRTRSGRCRSRPEVVAVSRRSYIHIYIYIHTRVFVSAIRQK